MVPTGEEALLVVAFAHGLGGVVPVLGAMVANRVDQATGDREVDGTLLGQAVESWNQVSVSSGYWLDAMFESSWAFFLADQFSRALGNVHSLESPYFPQAYYPEALDRKSVV